MAKYKNETDEDYKKRRAQEYADRKAAGKVISKKADMSPEEYQKRLDRQRARQKRVSESKHFERICIGYEGFVCCIIIPKESHPNRKRCECCADAENRRVQRICSAKWQTENLEKVRAQQRAAKKAEYARMTPEEKKKRTEKGIRWAKNNPDKVKASLIRYRQKLGAEEVSRREKQRRERDSKDPVKRAKMREYTRKHRAENIETVRERNTDLARKRRVEDTRRKAQMQLQQALVFGTGFEG